MAEYRPIGTAITMAINEMSAVPANSGTAPNGPGRTHLVGPDRHLRAPRRAEQEIERATRAEETEGFEGHRGDDAEVVNTAMVEQPISIHSTTSSTRLRARSSGVMRLRTTRWLPIAMTMTRTVSAMRLMPRR